MAKTTRAPGSPPPSADGGEVLASGRCRGRSPRGGLGSGRRVSGSQPIQRGHDGRSAGCHGPRHAAAAVGRAGAVSAGRGRRRQHPLRHCDTQLDRGSYAPESDGLFVFMDVFNDQWGVETDTQGVFFLGANPGLSSGASYANAGIPSLGSFFNAGTPGSLAAAEGLQIHPGIAAAPASTTPTNSRCRSRAGAMRGNASSPTARRSASSRHCRSGQLASHS